MTLKDFINQLHTVVDKSIPIKDDLSSCQVTDVIVTPSTLEGCER